MFGISVWPLGNSSDESIGSMTEEQAQTALSHQDHVCITEYGIVEADLSPEQWTKYPNKETTNNEDNHSH